ncbi:MULTISPECIES: methyl-accepting chemotaxis protein [unclassified Oleiphilus]|uniref:methyl-accepting chemotaxis protein n=1 Tax=unclassified Oleiphilus TaxID=2631174 RepID=UPI0007C32693|nr:MULTISPECIES: methyl-accepting chemotaxis protein [unclassified Oleiphilus]KZZ35800.1 hypothetical protein A3756_14645 [Oleiphilus sp. HI0086]KZZ59335.1 hypothetical protein A3761_05545 [Oleiphilus sp. HI0123]
MKINMPVTDNEVMMTEGQTLVSKTNLKGITTYVNEAFIAISGFSEQELVGKNHNVVRHPDMPPEAFKDLWDTMKKGRPWTGIVKNRCKNGDFYWVKANVTPIWEDGKVVEYMSVRSIPSREEITAAEGAYVALKNGEIALDGGNVVKSGFTQHLPKLSNIKLTQQFMFLGAVLLMLSALVVNTLAQQYDQIEFSKQELVGVEYIRPMRQLLQFIPQHRGMTNAYLNGDASFEPKILSVRQKINDLFDEAKEVDARLGEKLQASSKFKAIQRKWDSLKGIAFSLEAKASFSRHSDLISDVLNLIIHAGDTSNLILDPELGSFYSMDLVVNKIPALVENMGQARGLGSGVIANQEIGQAQLNRLTELKVGVDVNYKGLLTSYNSGASAEQRVKQRLGSLAADVERIIGGFISSVDHIRQGDLAISSMDAKSFFAEGTRGINKAFELYDESANLLEELLTERVEGMQAQFYIISALTTIAILMTLILGFALSRNILRSINQCLANFGEIASGNYREDIHVSGNNELTALMCSLKSMQIKMGFEVEEAIAIANSGSRIKQALDVCNTNVMLADDRMDIIYLNASVQKMFKDAEADLRSDLPNFDADNLLGASADVLYKDPSHQRAVIENLNGTQKSRMKTGGRVFDLMATPVINDQSERLGTVIEWNDITEELKRTEEERRIANENARMKQALDSVSANVMVADDQLNIIYMNDAVVDTLRNAEKDIQAELSNFAVDKIIGSNIDIFHNNPAHQRGMIERMTAEYSADIVVGGRNLNLVVNPIVNDEGERIGTVVEWDDQTEELKRLAKERSVANDNARIKQALDSVSANVMVANADRDIIYMNDAVISTLRNAESDIQKDLGNFNVNTLLGSSIDVFHKNPSHQKQLLESLTSEYSASLNIGGRNMDLVVNPITNDDNERIGTVVEWADRTNEVAIEQEIDRLVFAAANGDLSKRLDPEGKTGFFAKLAEGLNQTVGSADSFLADVGEVLSALSEGDLTKTISSEYRGSFGKVKTDVNATVTKLTEIITQIRESTSMVHEAANEISQGNADLSARTESQASSLEETAASMEEITSTVKESAGNASQANTVTSDAKLKAVAGGEVVHGAVGAMKEILASSHKINDIIGVIDEIAFQTNLLALNAAVEAARAGEHGRGFAVVAGEVRTLSQRSATAAKEIKDLIRESVNKVETGSQLVNDSGQTLADIVKSVEEVAVRVEEIATAAAEQNDGIGQINQAVMQMDDMTQQNAALVEEASASSEALSEQASALNQMVSFFRVGNHQAAIFSAPASAPTSAPAPTPSVSQAPQQTTSVPMDTGIAPTEDQVIKYSGDNSNDDDDWEDF